MPKLSIATWRTLLPLSVGLGLLFCALCPAWSGPPDAPKTQKGYVFFLGSDGPISRVPRLFHFHTKPENAALYSLLEGPTPQEQKQGFMSHFEGLKVKSSHINFSAKRMYVELVSRDPKQPWGPAGLGPAFAWQEISQTLKQFGHIKKCIVLIGLVSLEKMAHDGEASLQYLKPREARLSRASGDRRAHPSNLSIYFQSVSDTLVRGIRPIRAY